jgi:DNA invertase Pin-like site-specific DNA recombinase
MSTGRQELSPAAQAAAMDRWAAANSVTIVAVYFDLAVSGAAPVHERPGLVAALAALPEKGAGVLLAAKRDRVARDTGVMAVVESSVKAAGAVLRTADGASDGADDDEGAFVRRSVEDMVSVLERMKIRSRTKAALAIKRARGEKLGGHVPYGRRLGEDGVCLEVDPDEQATITTVRELAAAGMSRRKIVRELAVRGVVSRVGKPLQLTQVGRILALA